MLPTLSSDNVIGSPQSTVLTAVVTTQTAGLDVVLEVFSEKLFFTFLGTFQRNIPTSRNIKIVYWLKRIG